MLLGTGCAAPQAPASAAPAGRPQGPPALLSETEPARDVRSRLLQEARAAYDEGRYAAAARQLRRLLEAGADQPVDAEAHWWLAQSYERLGELAAAVAEYRAFLQTTETDTMAGRAERVAAARHVLELEGVLGVPAVSLRNVVALAVPAHRLGDQPDQDRWLEEVRRTGVTTLVVEAGTSADGSRRSRPDHASIGATERAGVYFHTAWAPVLEDALGPLVASAHRHGLAVVAALTLRRMLWVDAGLGWADRRYDPAAQALRPTPLTLDLFHPAVQEYLIGLLTDLAATGVDGLLFRADAPLGPTDGLSPFGLGGFEREFGVKLDPARLFARPAKPTPRPGRQGTGAEPDLRGAPPEFWRWTGWKMRESLAVTARVARAVQVRSPRLKVGLEVHPEAAVDPAAALVRYGEDLLEAKRSGLDFYVIAPAVDEKRNGAAGSSAGSELANRAVALIGEADRVWVTRLLSEGDRAPMSPRLTVAADRGTLPPGVGLLYAARGRAVP